ncbi:MAG: DHA2 family efflux MFS transporter permease subunit [Dehalococcoidia bacterium]|nr:DHA2 family efflux MFS transporter permease subunit [Dehalococcoidia bacterium]
MRAALLRSSNYRWWAFAAIGIGLFTSVVDYGTVAVALPTITDHFNSDFPTVQWIMVGYNLTISALLLPMGRLSDIIGRKQVYVTGLVLFVLGAALAGFSTNITILILSRVLMGCGAAMAEGTGMAMMVSVFSGNERGKALGSYMSVVGLGAISGPAIGGLLVSLWGWPSVFLFNVPLGILAIAASLIILDNRRMLEDRKRDRFDWLGATLSATALITLLLAATNGPRMGWGAPLIVAGGVAFLVFLAAFVWWELKTPTPMLDLRLFKRRTFSMGISAGFISFLGLSAIRYLIPFYLQAVLDYSPGKIGLILAPNAIAMIVIGPLSGRLSDRYGWRKLNVGGLLISAAGMFLLVRVTENSSLDLVLAGMLLQSCGLGFFNSPNSSSILSTVERHRYGVVTALLNLMRNSAQVMGIAVATAIVTATMASMGYAASLDAVSNAPGAFTTGFRIVCLAMASLTLLGVVISIVKGGRPAQAPIQQIGDPQPGGSQPD